MQPLIIILHLNFWHRSFLTTIMVDHYPLFEFAFACSKIEQCKTNVHHVYSSFMLCSFGISTEASAPAVLSLSNMGGGGVPCSVLYVVYNYSIINSVEDE